MRLEAINNPYPHNVLEAITDQSYVIRYSKVHVLRHQTDADHVGRGVQVAICVMNDLSRYIPHSDFPAFFTRVVAGFAIHDNAESIVGDVTYDIKCKFPEFDAVEDQLLDQMWKHVMPFAIQMRTREYMVMKSIDVAELVMFCTDDAQMGNRSKSLHDCLALGISNLTGYVMRIQDVFSKSEDAPALPTLNAILANGRKALIVTN